MSKEIQVKKATVDSFTTPYTADLTANNATVSARYIEDMQVMRITVENRTTSVYQTFSWEGGQAAFEAEMTQYMSRAVADFLKEIAREAYLDTILVKKTV